MKAPASGLDRITLTISVTHKVHQALTELAKRESRSKSAQAAKFIEEKLRQLKVL